MQKTNIEWVINSDGSPGFTSNPIKGKCGHFGTPVCGSYCYAERIRQRFNQPEAISFHDLELAAIEKRKKPSTIFMGSMHDIFGVWVPSDMILAILETVKRCPRHTFIFLTKNPSRYPEFDFPDNCWTGYSDDGTKDAIGGWSYFTRSKNRFVSFEPLIGRNINLNTAYIDAMIIGAMTGPGAVKPYLQVVQALMLASANKPLFIKNNLLKLFPEVPKIQQTGWKVKK